MSKSRRQFVADVLDSQVIKDVDYFTEPSFDFRVFYRATQALPVPPTLLDIELDGELSTARQLISDQLRDFYDLRVAETRAGRVFSPKLDAELLAFRRRLIAWARGRGRVHDIYRMLP